MENISQKNEEKKNDGLNNSLSESISGSNTSKEVPLKHLILNKQ